MNIAGAEGAVFDTHRATEKLLLGDRDTNSWLAGQPKSPEGGGLTGLT